MEKTFDPAVVERRVSARWADCNAFAAGRPDRLTAQPFTVMLPPPNVTGSLHMGHALNHTLQDILCRFERMRGRDVLWQPGMDHAGIATQMVVERQLMEQQAPNRRAMGRQKFIERVWAWKAESGGAILTQMKRLGASCDWSRERFTMDEGLSRAVLKTFVRLYKEGLIYRDKRLVNWDPKLLTALSDIEVVQVETKGHLWHFRYPVVDRSGAPTGEHITVATTRPETMLGDTGVAVHPDDARYAQLVGSQVRLPLVGRMIPIIADTYSDPEKGTGAVKITPAHDFNDFEVGRRHDLAFINIFDAEARLALQDNEAFFNGIAEASEARQTATHLHGFSREEARKRIIEMMEAADLLDKVEPQLHAVPHGDRSSAIVEPWLTDQWYVDAKILAAPALAAVREGRTRFVPKQYEKTYFDWLDNIQPWCISRQLWWGHQIPAWYGPDGTIFVEETPEMAMEAAAAHYGRKVELQRDEDVLDTWFSSALWPFSTLGWPDETAALARYYPTNTLITGFDIIFFWVARMMMMGLHLMGEAPFSDVYIHALVRDEKGAKMSKSKGNVLDPLGMIDTYGADALRFTLAAMAAQGRDVKLASQRVEGYRNFATKLWNAARFADVNGCARSGGFDPRSVRNPLNRWIVGEVAKAQADVTAAIEAYRFNDAANAVYRFIWNIFCDWYLELVKPMLQGEEAGKSRQESRAETQSTVAFVIDESVKLLHPFMPFLTEELWAIKGEEGPQRESVLALAPWSDLAGLQSPDADAEIGWIIDLVSEVRSVRTEMNVPAGAQVPLVLVAAGADVEDRVKVWGDTIKRLARLSEIDVAAEAPAQSVQMPIRGSLAALPLAGVIDFAAEQTRLDKEIAKLKGEVEKIKGKLGNAEFISRAPEEIVEEQRDRLAEAESRRAKLESALTRLAA